MEHCLRAATACLILVFTLLQARPIPTDDISKLKKVACGSNVTFASPTNVKVECYASAFNSILQQLNQAKNCTDEEELITNAQETLEICERSCPKMVQNNSTTCVWEREEDQKPFAEFVDDIDALMKQLNSYLVQ